MKLTLLNADVEQINSHSLLLTFVTGLFIGAVTKGRLHNFDLPKAVNAEPMITTAAPMYAQ